MPLYTYNGQLFQVSGSLAAASSCCCEGGGDTSCCYLGICLQGLTEEECESLAGVFRQTEPCEEDGLCECDDEAPVYCCLNHNCLDGSLYVDASTEDPVPITECNCLSIGGTPVGSCEECPSCDLEDETPFIGRICLPGGECLDINTTVGELCLFPFSYLVEEGISCDDEPPCDDVLPTGTCCWVINYIADYYTDLFDPLNPCFISYYEAFRCPGWGSACTATSSHTWGPHPTWPGWQGTGTIIIPRPCGCNTGYYVGVSSNTCAVPPYTNFVDPAFNCGPPYPPECP